MTRTAALKEARRRWGASGRAEFRWKAYCVGGTTDGYGSYGKNFHGESEVCGRGRTWEAAFADADRRAVKS